jgi:hypothetical protein
MTPNKDNQTTPRTDHFLQCLPARMPAEERLDQLTAYACDLERTLAVVIKQQADDQKEADDLRGLCWCTADTIAAGGNLHELEEMLRTAGELAGVPCTEDELLEDAQLFLRCWRSHQEYGTGNEEYLHHWRKRLEADCNASDFIDAHILERAEKLLDQDTAERVLGQQH